MYAGLLLLSVVGLYGALLMVYVLGVNILDGLEQRAMRQLHSDWAKSP